MSDLICALFFIVVNLAALVIYRRSFRQGYWSKESDPLFLDARRDESQIIEAGMITEQRRHGRELGGPVTLIINQEPTNYSAQLNLKSVREKGADVGVNVIEK